MPDDRFKVKDGLHPRMEATHGGKGFATSQSIRFLPPFLWAVLYGLLGVSHLEFWKRSSRAGQSIPGPLHSLALPCWA